MFSNNNRSQTVWVGLSFLLAGLLIGFVVANSDEFLSTNLSLTALDDSTGLDGSNTNPAVPEVNVDELPVVAVDVDDDAILGDPAAPVTIVEFSDFQCPYCQTFFKETLPQIVENYVDTGKVRIVYRDFPLGGHKQAAVAAQAAECYKKDAAMAADEAYYEFHDWLFENVALWSGQENATELLIQAAEDNFGADLRTCLESGEMADEVNADLAAGRSYGVTGTPSFFINGKQLVGAWPYEIFEKVIESEL